MSLYLGGTNERIKVFVDKRVHHICPRPENVEKVKCYRKGKSISYDYGLWVL